jgi:hypothetical protein
MKKSSCIFAICNKHLPVGGHWRNAVSPCLRGLYCEYCKYCKYCKYCNDLIPCSGSPVIDMHGTVEDPQYREAFESTGASILVLIV